EGCVERGDHAVGRVELVELRSAEEARDVPRARVGQPYPEAGAEETVAFPLPELLRLVQQRAALVGQRVELEAEPLVELVVVRRAQLLHRLAINLRRIEV